QTKEFNIRRPLLSASLGEILFQRHQLDDPTTKVMVDKFGYRQYMNQLVPPQNLPALYARIFFELITSARASGLSDDEILLPAFPFVREDRISKKRSYLFIRPGIDSLPNRAEGWRPELSMPELKTEEYQQLILEGKYLLDPIGFFHDIGHFIDYIERPRYMPDYRHLVSKKNAIAHSNLSEAEKIKLYGQIILTGDLEFFINERLYLPSEKNVARIHQIIPTLKTDSFMSLENTRSLYKNKSSTELVRSAKSFLKNRFLLFSSHGGASRDRLIDVNLATPEFTINGLEETFKTESDQRSISFFPPYDKNVSVYLIHEPVAIFQRLEYLIAYKEGQTIPIEIERYISQMMKDHSYKDMQNFVDVLISYHLAEIQFKIQIALLLKITPEQIATDTALLYEPEGWKKYQLTNTYRYFSTFRHNTIQWKLGYEAARP
ncbi:MAG TPA: hypothetical protein VN132_00630, partial [Bdellovibrio sp.]|nr:hypothetical protein [Bdellovibrio sp.]